MSKKRKPEWVKWEREFGSDFGMNQVVASGSTDNFKGDCKGNKFLVDCKYTERKTYSLTFDMWEKINHWAINENRSPMLAARTCGGDFIVMREATYYSITGDNRYGDDVKRQKSVAVGKQKHANHYKIADGCACLDIIVVPIDDVREAILSYEQSV